MIKSKNITNPLNIAICTNQSVGADADVVLSYNTTDPEKNLLDERDEIVFNIKSLLNNIPAGSTIVATFYSSEAFGTIGTETITLPEITKDLVPSAYYGFYSEYSKRAKYFTLAITLKKGTAYTVSIECLLKKKIVDVDMTDPELVAALALKADKLQYCTKEILISGAEVLDGATNSADAYTVVTNVGSVIIRNFGGAAGDVNSNVKINFRMPDDYVAGTPIKYSVAGTISNATKLASGEKVAFSLAGCVITDNIGLDLAVGTAVVVSKTAAADYVQYKRWETTFSGDVTLTDAIPNGYVKLNLTRATDNVNDTYAKPIGVSSITIKYQKSIQSV